MFTVKVNMEKRLEAQNPPRGAERGHQLGADEGRAKNIMTWLSRKLNLTKLAPFSLST